MSPSSNAAGNLTELGDMARPHDPLPRALDVSKVLEGQVYQVTSDMSNESENL